MLIKRNCQQCNNFFQAQLKEINRGYAKYCSRTCFGLAHRGSKFLPSNTTCAWCGSKFRTSPYNLRTSKSGLHFCCRKHKDKAQSLDGLSGFNLPHYGKGNGRNTYRAKTLATFPHICVRCSYNKYTEVLVVHHKDRNRDNNSLDNLELLCRNCHYEEHRFIM